MSNYLAIATVTSTLAELLKGPVEDAVPGAEVVTASPASESPPPTDPQANVFLFQLSPNPGLRNEHLPSRRSDGSLTQRPVSALDLYYLISFFGTERQVLEPQRMLGNVVSALEAHPVLTREETRTLKDNADPGHFLEDSDLADQVELVRLSMMSLSTEELSKIWSVLYQVPYVLSIVYRASVVLIEADLTPQKALPVRRRVITALPFRRPTLESVAAAGGSAEPIVVGTDLVLTGEQLRSENTSVRLGNVDVEPATLSGSRIELTVPAGEPDLRAGVVGVRVAHRDLFVESNAVPVVLRPSIARLDGDYDFALAAATDSPVLCPDDSDYALTVGVEPDVGRSQRALVWLNELRDPDTSPPPAGLPNAYSFQARPRDEDEPVGSLVFCLTGVASGSYLLRVQVDGAESPLDVDEPSGRYAGPLLEIP